MALASPATTKIVEELKAELIAAKAKYSNAHEEATKLTEKCCTLSKFKDDHAKAYTT